MIWDIHHPGYDNSRWLPPIKSWNAFSLCRTIWVSPSNFTASTKPHNRKSWNKRPILPLAIFTLNLSPSKHQSSLGLIDSIKDFSRSRLLDFSILVLDEAKRIGAFLSSTIQTYPSLGAISQWETSRKPDNYSHPFQNNISQLPSSGKKAVKTSLQGCSIRWLPSSINTVSGSIPET